MRDFNDSILSNDDWISFSLHDFSYNFQCFLYESDFSLYNFLFFFDKFFFYLNIDCFQSGVGFFWSWYIFLMQFFDDFYFS